MMNAQQFLDRSRFFDLAEEICLAQVDRDRIKARPKQCFCLVFLFSFVFGGPGGGFGGPGGGFLSSSKSSGKATTETTKKKATTRTTKTTPRTTENKTKPNTKQKTTTTTV